MSDSTPKANAKTFLGCVTCLLCNYLTGSILNHSLIAQISFGLSIVCMIAYILLNRKGMPKKLKTYWDYIPLDIIVSEWAIILILMIFMPHYINTILSIAFIIIGWSALLISLFLHPAPFPPDA